MLYAVVTDILAVIVVLGVMILIHEFGHFIAAKYFGVRVEVFSFGFGKRLVGIQKGETDYRISLLPLGGYVKMAGETTADEITGSPEEFQIKPRWQRFIIAIMGPTMNILLAVVLLWGLNMFDYERPAYLEGPAVVGYVEPDSPAAAAGIRFGDRIESINGMQNPKWGDIELLVASNVGEPLQVEIQRDGERLTRSVVPKPEGRAELGSVGWDPMVPAKIGSVDPGSPAAEAGLRPGDYIVSINGDPVGFGNRLSEMVQQSQGKPIEVLYSRNGQQATMQITPRMGSGDGEAPQSRWLIGVRQAYDVIRKRLGPLPALAESVSMNEKNSLLIFAVVGKIFSREMSPRSFEGPIGIARLSGAAAREGLGDLVQLMAAISLNLGIFNLFPIPVLDGGLILLLLIESTMRRDLSRPTKERITQVGFAFLMLIAVFVIYNDIVKTLPERIEHFFP